MPIRAGPNAPALKGSPIGEMSQDEVLDQEVRYGPIDPMARMSEMLMASGSVISAWR